jgi:hypothetical protein
MRASSSGCEGWLQWQPHVLVYWTLTSERRCIWLGQRPWLVFGSREGEGELSDLLAGAFRGGHQVQTCEPRRSGHHHTDHRDQRRLPPSSSRLEGVSSPCSESMRHVHSATCVCVIELTSRQGAFPLLHRDWMKFTGQDRFTLKNLLKGFAENTQLLSSTEYGSVRQLNTNTKNTRSGSQA